MRNNLDYGCNEGIYLDLWIKYREDGKLQQKELGTYKTLGTSDEDMHTMAVLLADFIIEEWKYVNANLDDFTWGARSPVDFGSAPTGVERKGADVSYYDKSGKHHPGWSCGTMERALEKKDELVSKYPKVIVRDNATRKETVYEQNIGG